MLIEWNGGNRPPRMIIAVDSTITLYTADGEPLVTIRPDGSLHYHTGYTPDEAARAFRLRPLAHLRLVAGLHMATRRTTTKIG